MTKVFLVEVVHQSRISSVVSGSRFPVGSSANKSGGSLKLLASNTLLFPPAEFKWHLATVVPWQQDFNSCFLFFCPSNLWRWCKIQVGLHSSVSRRRNLEIRCQAFSSVGEHVGRVPIQCHKPIHDLKPWPDRRTRFEEAGFRTVFQ